MNMPAKTPENPSPLVSSQQLLAALQTAVTSALERKRRLGHYVVVWQNGGPVAFGDDAPKPNHSVHAAEPAAFYDPCSDEPKA